jgi:hypothetical protein
METESRMLATAGGRAEEMGRACQRVQACSYMGWRSLENLMYTRRTVITNVENLLRVDFRCFNHERERERERE